MKSYCYILIIGVVLSWVTGLSQPRVGLVTVASGFDHPVCMANSGDSRLFIIEQPGIIRIMDSTGSVLSTPFLDLTDRVVYGGERGLLGIAFHPDYFYNGYFYVDYTGAGDSTHISRFSVSSSDPNTADPNSEMKMMTIYQPYQNHNGGDVNFGPDGYLYIGMGDGGSAGDPGNRAQDSLQLLGKMLRIDVDGGIPYAIPPTNPFIGNPNARPEIWALGLRNPWRFSFDRLTGDMFIGDVGQDNWEEIDFQPVFSTGGENWGWRCYEGFTPYNLSGCLPDSDFKFPVHVYPHGGPLNDCSVTGGYRYRGILFPNMTGYYFFSDYCSDKIWSLYDSSGSWGTIYHGNWSGNNFSTFGEDKNGELYIAGLTSGTIYHIIDSSAQSVSRIDPGEITIYPNPFSGHVNIVIKGSRSEYEHYIITDIRGITLDEGFTANEETDLDLGSLAPGLYILQLDTGSGMKFGKLLKK
jgi:hypothetical protein